MAKRQHPHHHGFPRPVARFLQLEGGQYGTVDLIALTPHDLEMQLGADFVQFTRKQAEDFRDAVQCFLDFGDERRRPPPRTGVEAEIVDEVEAVVAEREVIEEALPRRRRGRPS
jgi:hypothetical protein